MRTPIKQPERVKNKLYLATQVLCTSAKRAGKGRLEKKRGSRMSGVSKAYRYQDLIKLLSNHLNLLNPLNGLLTNAEFLDQGTILQDVFFGIVAQKALAVTNKAQQGTATSKIFFV